MTKVVIVGAGPAGLLLASNLIQRENYEVLLYERRPDPRNIPADELRTYPIAVDWRGLQAVRSVPGLEAALEESGRWMAGAALQGGRKPRNIKRPPSLSVDRNQIVLTFLTQLSAAPPASKSSVKVHFKSTVLGVEMDKKVLVIQSKEGKTERVGYDYLVAADGANSNIRSCLVERGEMTCSAKKIPDEYKAFYIPRESTDGSITLASDLIHVWMLGRERVITVPLQPDTCSGVYIYPQGKDPFARMTDPAQVKKHIKWKSRSLVKFVTDEEATNLYKRPSAGLWSIRCDRLFVKDVLLVGDAAHAVSASIGQGCNSSLQDILLFNGHLDQYQDDWDNAGQAFEKERLPQAHAVSELSDYAVPRSMFMRLEFMIRTILKALLPLFLSKHLGMMPTEALAEPNTTYCDVLDKCKWWTDRVKRSSRE